MNTKVDAVLAYNEKYWNASVKVVEQLRNAVDKARTVLRDTDHVAEAEALEDAVIELMRFFEESSQQFQNEMQSWFDIFEAEIIARLKGERDSEV